MFPCGRCRAVAVGPDGRCAACGAVGLPPAPAPAYPYPYPAAPMAAPAGGIDLRRGVRIALTVLLVLNMLLLLLLVVAAGNERAALDAMLSNGLTDATARKADDADNAASVLSLLHILAFLAAGVLWVVWFRRARLNAEVFAPGTHRFGSGWAVGSWFTPVVNLWFPKQMANDIYRASSPAGPQAAPKGLLNSWWVLWITANVISSIGSTMEAVAAARMKTATRGGHYSLDDWRSDAGSLKSALAVQGLSTLLLAVAALLALLVVRQLSRMQEQRAALGPQFAPQFAQQFAPPVAMGAPAWPGMPAAPAPYGAPAHPPVPPVPPGPPQNPFGNGPAGC
ncbi:DUF4328 domain-containing protein [Streptomyces sp. ET3-23]|uniref:DUF4328 domain-containing protein n=1 Tax=Streptomyces sp. ET3-23 TaxID=2885643 RepID=UPI0022351CE5|nr:DUF4328 domain-containing protein [Streptomyces sp. ET3-23]